MGKMSIYKKVWFVWIKYQNFHILYLQMFPLQGYTQKELRQTSKQKIPTHFAGII